MWRRISLYFLLMVFFVGPLWLLISGEVNLRLDWRTASRASVGIAPDPSIYKGAVVQVYKARTYGWRGLFAVHTWIAVKPSNAKDYTIYQVIGWNYFFGLSPLSIRQGIPDRMWFGQKPMVIKDLRGQEAEAIISKIDTIARSYPYIDHYTLWPGPNSNTFVAYIARRVPELKLTMPPNAVGKDYIDGGKVFARAPSGTGYQFSLYGIIGATVAKQEGLEINILGLVIGFSLKQQALILPGVGYFF